MSKEVNKEQVNRLKDFESELNRLLSKYQYQLAFELDFPMYRELPIEVQLALEVITAHKYNIRMGYVDVSKQPNETQNKEVKNESNN